MPIYQSTVLQITHGLNKLSAQKAMLKLPKTGPASNVADLPNPGVEIQIARLKQHSGP